MATEAAATLCRPRVCWLCDATVSHPGFRARQVHRFDYGEMRAFSYPGGGEAFPLRMVLLRPENNAFRAFVGGLRFIHLNKQAPNGAGATGPPDEGSITFPVEPIGLMPPALATVDEHVIAAKGWWRGPVPRPETGNIGGRAQEGTREIVNH